MKLFYFAWVRQKIGRGEEDLKLPANVTTISELMSYLESRGVGYADAFSNPERLRSARNQEHVDLAAAVRDEDEIAFFPPVTGG